MNASRKKRRATTPLSRARVRRRGSLLVLNHQGVGDNVLTIPFLRAIPKLFPDFKRELMIIAGRRDLFGGVNGFRITEFENKRAVARLLGARHDIVFDLGTGTERLRDRVFKKLKYGTYVDFSKPRSIRDECAIPLLADVAMWRQYLALLAPFGETDGQAPSCQVAMSESDVSYVDMLLGSQTGIPLVTIAPGASGDHGKRWPAERFAALIEGLREATLCRFVLVGRDSEIDIGDAIAARLRFPVDNLIGITPLGAVMHIVKRSRLLVANDNGIMHIGGLLNTPTIGLFGPSDARLFHPLGDASRVVQSPSKSMADLETKIVLQTCLDLWRLPDAVPPQR